MRYSITNWLFFWCVFTSLYQNLFKFFYFKDIPTSIFVDRLKQQVSDQLKFYDNVELPAEMFDVMQLAL
jgi:hypothetical protein